MGILDIRLLRSKGAGLSGFKDDCLRFYWPSVSWE